VNLYTLLSDVQRGANDLRQDVRGVLLDRLHQDQPVGIPRLEHCQSRTWTSLVHNSACRETVDRPWAMV